MSLSAITAALQGTSANTNTSRPPAGERAMAIAELRTMIFSHLDSKTLFSLRTVCRSWHATILGDEGSRRKLFLLAEEAAPHINAARYREVFLKLPRFGRMQASAVMAGSTPAVLNPGLAARVKKHEIRQQAHHVLNGGCISSVTVRAAVIQEVREEDIRFGMLLVNPPIKSVQFEFHFFAKSIGFGDGVLPSGTVFEEDGVTVGHVQAAVKRELESDDWLELSGKDEIKLVFENVLLLKEENIEELQ